MRKLAVLLAACAIIVLQAMPLFAEANLVEYDPLKRNLLFVEGEAEKEFPVNIFRLKFGFDIQKGNFSEANAYSARIIDSISASVKDLELSDVKIIKGWGIVKQAKISIGASGSKLSNQLIIEVRNFPAGKLHELIVKIIDTSLAVDKEVYLEGVEVAVTEDMGDKYKEEELMEALKRLRANAEKTAQTQDRKISAVKRIFVLSDQETVAVMDRSGYSYMMEEKSLARKAFVSVQKGFTVRSDITDHIKISAKVAGIYEIE